MSDQSLETQKDKMQQVRDDVDVNRIPKSSEPTKNVASKMYNILIIVLVLLLVLLCLHLVSTAITLFNFAVQERDKVCNCADGAKPPFQTCDSWQINETHEITQDIRQMINYTTQLQKKITSETMLLLQQMLTAQVTFTENTTEVMSFIQDQTENSLSYINDTLSAHIKDTSNFTAAVISDMLELVKESMQLKNALLLLITHASCKDIRSVLPNSPSGYYHVNSRMTYCNMEELCGSKGGWTRLAYLDMSDLAENCPDELYQADGVRACGRSSSGCSSSIKFPTNGIEYSEICGRVHGYQKGTPDAFHSSNDDINSYYVDGVSLTRGSPRQHVWTFAGGSKENYQDSTSNCPCNAKPTDSQNVPSFVDSHYSCESGNPDTNAESSKVYTADLLWDGQDCGSKEQACCSADGTPWFHRQYDNTSTDYLELRICGTSDTTDEDTPVSFYEIYVK